MDVFALVSSVMGRKQFEQVKQKEKRVIPEIAVVAGIVATNQMAECRLAMTWVTK